MDKIVHFDDDKDKCCAVENNENFSCVVDVNVWMFVFKWGVNGKEESESGEIVKDLTVR